MSPKQLSAIRAMIGSALRSPSLRWTVLLTLAGPIVLGLLNIPEIRAQSPQPTVSPLPSFEVASIKLNRSGGPRSHMWYPTGRFIASNQTIKALIEFAYNIQAFQLSGGPNWINSEKYDIDAKAEDSIAEGLQKLSFEQWREQLGLMLQSLLADRFNLKVSHETRELPVYALVIAKNGPTLQVSKPDGTLSNPTKGSDNRGQPGMSTSRITDGSMADLARGLSHQLGRIVLDQTGLKGKYDFTLQYSHDENPDSSGPSIFSALQEQLGLKLESTKGPVDVLVIDHIERPSEN
jgi:uncharacterized protein (TIGR03435 family)